jgi:SAM-dependent methyltransferase
MTARPAFDRDFWEERWSQVLREHGKQIARRPPNTHLTGAVESLRPGRALDAGCGHGSETLWLATRGWRVTAVDFSAAALAHARSTAEALGADVAERIDWVEGDLASWTPQPGRYDLVTCLYVHIAGSVEETPAAGQVQVSVDAAVAALEPDRWEFAVAENRPRAQVGSGVDAVICARRLP